LSKAKPNILDLILELLGFLRQPNLQEANFPANDELVSTLKKHVSQEIGAIARPGEIRFTDALPKTRSGKIMRRLLRDLAAGKEVSGDTSTLEDRSVLDKLRGND
jgi:acetyl-CoA synthetase